MTLKGSPQQGSSSSSVGGVTLQDLQRIPTHFFTEGVVESVSGQLAVSEKSTGANMSVDIAAGLCVVELTTTLLTTNHTVKTWLQNTATVNVQVPTADATNERIDRIIAKFDPTTDPDGTLGNNVSIELVEGTPAGSPSAPATPSNAISLATISVPASDTTISNAQITDDRNYVQIISTVLQDLARQSDVDTEVAALKDDTPTWLGTITGTDTLTGGTTPAKTAYATGQRFAFIVANDNTGAVTLNIDSLGAKALKSPTGAALIAQDLQVGGVVEVRYDGTAFYMFSPKHSPLATPDVSALKSTTAKVDKGASVTTEQVVFSYQIDANTLVAGDILILEGNYASRIASGAMTTRLKFGGVTLGTFSIRVEGKLYAIIGVRSIGATGVLTSLFEIGTGGTVFGLEKSIDENANESNATVDTTANANLEITAQFSLSNSLNTAATNLLSLRRITGALSIT